MSHNNKAQIITVNAIIAAIYVVLSLINPIDTGVFQFRLAGLLMGVGFYDRRYAPGVIAGVFLTALSSPLGPIDIVTGLLIQLVSFYVIARFVANIYLRSLGYGLWCGFVLAFMLQYAVQAPWLLTFISTTISNSVIAILGAFIMMQTIGARLPFFSKEVA